MGMTVSSYLGSEKSREELASFGRAPESYCLKSLSEKSMNLKPQIPVPVLLVQTFGGGSEGPNSG